MMIQNSWTHPNTNTSGVGQQRQDQPLQSGGTSSNPSSSMQQQQQFATPIRSNLFHSNTTSQTPSPYNSMEQSSASKSVRFQNQPPTAAAAAPSSYQHFLQQQQQQQSQQLQSRSPSTSTPIGSSSVTRSTQQTSNSVQSASNATPNRAVVSHNTPSSATKSGTMFRSTSNAAPSSGGFPTSLLASTTPPPPPVATYRRLRWNVSCLALLWIVPSLTDQPRRVYWWMLDQIYLTFGSALDEKVDAVVGWILWATSVVLIFNTVEAGIMLLRPQESILTGLGTVTGTGGVKQQQQSLVSASASPSWIAKSQSSSFVKFNTLKGSPKTRQSLTGPNSPITSSSPPSTTKVGVGSGSSVIRKRISSSSNLAATPAGVGGGEGERIDFANFSPSSRRASATSSPLTKASSPISAFKSRHQYSTSSSPSPSAFAPRSGQRSISSSYSPSPYPTFDDARETSFDIADNSSGVVDEWDTLGDDSWQVEKALASLRSSVPPPDNNTTTIAGSNGAGAGGGGGVTSSNLPRSNSFTGVPSPAK